MTRMLSSTDGQELARIIIGDGDPLARRALREALDQAPDFVVVAEARDSTEATELALHYRPEVVLLELALPGAGGVATMTRILEAAPELRVAILTTWADDDSALDVLRAGASGFVGKQGGVDGIIDAVRAVARGEVAASPPTVSRLVEHLRSVPELGIGVRPVKSALTPREWEVVDLLTVGRTTQEMADELYLVPDTVHSHVKSILRKLNVHSRADAVERAQELRWHGGTTPALAMAA
jgi:NarL family two-component system response regulator LiaR